MRYMHKDVLTIVRLIVHCTHMAKRTEPRGLVVRPADWLADEHAQRDIERQATPIARTIRTPRSSHHTRGARQLAILGRVFGATGTDGDS